MEDSLTLEACYLNKGAIYVDFVPFTTSHRLTTLDVILGNTLAITSYIFVNYNQKLIQSTYIPICKHNLCVFVNYNLYNYKVGSICKSKFEKHLADIWIIAHQEENKIAVDEMHQCKLARLETPGRCWSPEADI